MKSDPGEPRRFRVGIIGAGRVGTALARTALRAGHDVAVAGSGTPEELALVAAFTMPGAVVGDEKDVVGQSELIILAVPLKRFSSVNHALLAERVVIDVMNLWEPVDGFVPGFSDAITSSSEVVQRSMPSARVVKTLNHIGYHDLESNGRPAGSSDRRALAIASDDDGAAGIVAEFIDSLGYDPVIAGALRSGVAFQPGTPIFDSRLDVATTRRLLDGYVARNLQEA